VDVKWERRQLQEIAGASSAAAAETLKFIAIDSMPGDTPSTTNVACTPATDGSACVVIDGAMVVEINQPGEEASYNAAVKVLGLIEGFMKFKLYGSPENGITDVRYIGPDLALLLSPTSRINDSMAVDSNGASSSPPIVMIAFIGMGVLALVVVASYSVHKMQRRIKHVIHSSYDEESSSIVSSYSNNTPGPLVTTAMLDTSSSPEIFTRKNIFTSTASSTRIMTSHGVSFVIPYGYTEISDCNYPEENIPPPICFDLVEPTSFRVDSTATSERGDEKAVSVVQELSQSSEF
jgi:hypothetical protein